MNSLDLIKKKPKKMKIKDIAKIMGRQVLVTKVYREQGDTIRKRWEAYPAKPRSGWVVGTTWMQTGTYDRYEGYFQETGPRTQCLLVRYWPNRKPVKVPLDGYSLLENNEGPQPHGDAYRWSEEDKKIFSEEAKRQPRDSKGRFVAINTKTGARDKMKVCATLCRAE